MEPVSPLIDLGRGGSPAAIAEAQFYSLVTETALAGGDRLTTGFVRGSQRTDATPDQVLEGWTVRGDWRLGWTHMRVAELRGRYAMVTADANDGMVDISVFSAKGPKDAQNGLDALLSLCPTVPAPEKGIEARFWAMGPMAPISYLRQIDAPAWSDVAANYPDTVRADIGDLASWSTAPSGAGGRLLLMHGPAGTGKTSTIRALAHSWRDWADTNVITDADEFFGHSAYMMSVLLNGESDYTFGTETPKWRLVVVEDCDEILTANARERSGHAVSRLLNVCDGMVGQGLRILVLLTTNESVDNFHAAIVRPGRCLKNMHFPAFDAAQADTWRASRGLATTGTEASLAELYAEDRTGRKTRALEVAAHLRANTETFKKKHKTARVPLLRATHPTVVGLPVGEDMHEDEPASREENEPGDGDGDDGSGAGTAPAAASGAGDAGASAA